MLEKFRNKQLGFYSTLIIAFALMAKMLVPIAHASAAHGNGEKSFFASLCSGNKVVSITLNLPDEQDQSAKTALATGKCPLCCMHEQDANNTDIVSSTVQAAFGSHRYVNIDDALRKHHLKHNQGIRAPPTIS